MTTTAVGDIVSTWRKQGRPFTAAGVSSVVWEEGSGEPVVCLHGVPVSAFVYRKLLPEIGRRALRGVAFDFPGLGLAERPSRFDYRWSGLATWTAAALDALRIERYHLVLHDLGGPIGFEVIRRAPERVLSLTVLNTIGRPATFRRPPIMAPFAVPVLGEFYLATTTARMFEMLMRWQGVSTKVPSVELRAHHALLKREDGGRAFLRIMRGFELTVAFERPIADHFRERSYPAQVIWGENDPALTLKKRGEEVRELVGAHRIVTLPSKHFVQEDCPAELADRVAAQVLSAIGQAR